LSAVRAYDVAEISELGDFLGLEAEWNALLDESACDLPFMRHEWFHVWWNHFGAGKRLSILVARRDGRLALAMPLYEERVAWLLVPFVTLRSITNAHSFRYHLLLRRGEEESVRAAWQYLARRPRPWHMLELERFETGMPADRELVLAAERDHHPVGVWTGGESPYLRLEGTWEQYLASLKQKFRANLRNRLKRLRQMGTLEYELVGERSLLASALDDAFAIERSGWKGEQGSAIAQDPALRAFYGEWAERAADLGWLRLWFLKLNGKRIAFEYDLEYKRILYCMKIGYEPELQPYAVGQVLKAGVLERAFQDGLREYNFLGVMDEAKRGWTSEGRPFQWLHVYNGSVLPRLHHAYKFALKQSLKKVLHR
jgi:CelD/BcsL family acetyltransferase involved in cellulose biosynthesis